MKVKIYVQEDLTALVVPHECANRVLSAEKEQMKNLAVKTVESDLDDSIIGLDRENAKRGIQKDGHYVNTFGKRHKEEN